VAQIHTSLEEGILQMGCEMDRSFWIVWVDSL
jgi:hypothetical protein